MTMSPGPWANAAHRPAEENETTPKTDARSKKKRMGQEQGLMEMAWLSHDLGVSKTE